MTPRTLRSPEVFSARELARVTGAPVRRIQGLIRAAVIPSVDGSLVTRDEAIRACRAVIDGTLALQAPPGATGLFSQGRSAGTRDGRSTGASLLVSGAVHLALAGMLVLATVAAPRAVPDETVREPPDLIRLVFLVDPGPGGGGGGGGQRRPEPPPAAERMGVRPVSSPLPPRRPPTLTPPRARPAPPPPKTLEPEPLPPLLAPLVAVAADRRNVTGLLARVMTAATVDSRGQGTLDGVGTGAGVGVGQGTGRGVGPGDGGGVGGGPYRPGSGIDPPRLVREVTPDYTEDARKRGIEGEVLLEIVVGAEGDVIDVRVLRRLGAGLDERAEEAVRQWRFSPARRLGTPVAVVVEVAVEFRLR